MRVEGALAATIAFTVGSIGYAFVVWVPYRKLRRETIPERDESMDGEKRSQSFILKQYYPLAVSSILMATVEPVIQAAIARSPGSEVALASYPVIISMSWLFKVHLWNAQQIGIARVKSYPTYLDVRRFMTSISGITTVLLAVLMVPGVSEWVFGGLMGLQGPVKDLAIKGLPIAIVIPALQAVRSFYYGTLISQEATGGIQTAAFARIGILVTMLVAGVAYGKLNGLYLALIANAIGDLTECFVLRIFVKRIDWKATI
jgi:Na+-driven multidrug efflux pump